MGERTERTPAPVLPALHFAAAFAAFLAGAAGLVVAAPDLAAGAYLAFPVIGVAHLFTLGFVTTSIMGVLYQFLPMGVGAGIRSERVAHVTFALFVPGTLLFSGGTAAADHAMLRLGLALVGAGVVLFAGNLAATLARAPARGLTWWGLAVGGTNLLLVLALGGALAVNLGSGGLGASRLAVTGAHVHLALLGFVMPVVIGVGSRLLPTFLQTHAADSRPSVAALALLGTGAPALAAGLGFGSRALVVAGTVLALAGLGAFGLQVGLFLRRRRAAALDPGMRAAMAGVAALVAAAALGPVLLVTGGRVPGLVTGYGLLAVLGLALFVVGHYHRILPHFVWRYRLLPSAAGGRLPRPDDLLARRPAALATGLLAAGAATLVAGAIGESPGAARWGALAFAAGATLVTLQMAALAFARAPRGEPACVQ